MGNKNIRAGKEAFDPNANRLDLCPFDQLFESDKYCEWMSGWNIAKARYEDQENEKEEHIAKFSCLSGSCPWRADTYCLAVDKDCCIENCAVWHFLKG